MPSLSLKSPPLSSFFFPALLSTRGLIVTFLWSCLRRSLSAFPPMDQCSLMRSRREKVCYRLSPSTGQRTAPSLSPPCLCLCPCLRQPETPCSLTPEVLPLNMMWHERKILSFIRNHFNQQGKKKHQGGTGDLFRRLIPTAFINETDLLIK